MKGDAACDGASPTGAAKRAVAAVWRRSAAQGEKSAACVETSTSSRARIRTRASGVRYAISGARSVRCGPTEAPRTHAVVSW
eukprot:6192311-Pleurochrysis_carterae.AAC.5